MRRTSPASGTVANRRVRAEWNGVTIAESDATVVVEGNHYFPPEAIDRRYLEDNEKRSTCPWKGTAQYYDVVVDGRRNAAAAWTYPEVKPAAKDIEDHVAFWNGVDVREANA